MREALLLSLVATQGILGLVVVCGHDLGAADAVNAAVRAAAHAAGKGCLFVSYFFLGAVHK